MTVRSIWADSKLQPLPTEFQKHEKTISQPILPNTFICRSSMVVILTLLRTLTNHHILLPHNLTLQYLPTVQHPPPQDLEKFIPDPVQISTYLVYFRGGERACDALQSDHPPIVIKLAHLFAYITIPFRLATRTQTDASLVRSVLAVIKARISSPLRSNYNCWPHHRKILPRVIAYKVVMYPQLQKPEDTPSSPPPKIRQYNSTFRG